jgi:dihydroorotase
MILINKATIINEGKTFIGSVLIEGERISEIFTEDVPEILFNQCKQVIDARGLYLIPGVIDSHVHFREPGLTYKGDISTESRAAIAGGVTSYMEMPNTVPQTTTIANLNEKFDIASKKSLANFSFYLGATNDNIKELQKADKKHVCGVKVFLGASTGNMLVDKTKALQQIFAEVDMLITTHCEKEEIISENAAYYQRKFGDNIPIVYHPLIRCEEACFRSSMQVIEMAKKYDSRLHVLHLSTECEMTLFSNAPLAEKKITAEACVHHLWFSDMDYTRLGARIKWNPAIKMIGDRAALRNALKSGKIDIVATDHAPHLLSEKEGGCLQAASGGPLIQSSLQAMLELANKGVFTKELVVDKMCHAPAQLYRVKERGFIREGYFADLVLINPNEPQAVTSDTILYKCGWSPFEGETFGHRIKKTFVNGNLVFDNGIFVDNVFGKALVFDR